MSATIDDLPLDESGDAAVLTQAKLDQAEEPRRVGAISPESLLRFAETPTRSWTTP